MRLVVGNLKYLWLIFVFTAFIAIGLSCGRREVEEVSKNSELNHVDLDEYRWENRLVLIFASSSKDSSYLKLKDELSTPHLVYAHIPLFVPLYFTAKRATWVLSQCS